MSNQLVKKNPVEGYQNIFPKTWIDAIKDKESGVSLQEILQGFNMYFLSYNGSRALTRCKVPSVLRKEGLWITYVLYNHTVVTEWYNSDQIDDNSWSMDSNWRVASNALVGDISVSADGYWVINGEKTEAKAQGEQGVTPLLRVGANNKLQVSYNAGKAWKDISDYIVPRFKWNQGVGTTAGTIQISMDLGKTWTNLSNEITNNLRISRYIGINESLPTSGIAEGTIYMKGPYYNEGDTSNANPIYRMWIYAWKGNTLAWQDNGEFTTISADVVQERGTSTTEVMSQDAVTRELTKLEDEVNQLGQQVSLPERERLLLSECNTDDGYIKKTDGSFVRHLSYCVYTVSVEKFTCFFAELSAEADSYAISFIDESGHYIAESGIVGQNSIGTRELKFYKAESIPSLAKFVRFSTYKDIELKLWGVRSGIELRDVMKTLNLSTSFLSTTNYYNSANQYIRYSTLEAVATGGSITYFYKNDGYKKVVADIMCKTYNMLAIGFKDYKGDFITTQKYEALIGRNIYVVDVPDDANMIVVSNPEKDNDFNVWIFRNVPKEINKIDTVFSNAVQKNRFENYDVLKGYIRKAGYENAGQLTLSEGARTLIYKNQGIKTIDVWATFPGTEGVAASFNVISLYTVDGWLNGQGYMSSDSVSAIYGSVRKHYNVNVPANCGLILVTLNATNGVIDDNTAVIELNDGNKGNYLDDAHNISDMRFVLPSYYTESYLRNKISIIEARMKLNASNSDCFIWQTDEHFERSAGYSYGLIRILCNKLNIPRLFSGGDTAHMGINMDLVKLRRKAFDGKIYQVIGNHEYLSYTFETDGATTEDDIFYGLENYYGNDVVFGNKQRHYYYVNNDVQKIRYIVLSAFAQGDGVTNSATVGFEQAQLDWFENIALNVESGWSIIIFTHRLFEGSPSNTANTYIPQTCQPVADIIENYLGSGKIIAVFQGHTHYDMIKYLSNGTIPVIITTCDNNGLYRYDETLQEYVKNYDVERESGTIREHAFDVVTIDKTLKRISLVRIGCPARDGSEPNGELVEERIVYWQ